MEMALTLQTAPTAEPVSLADALDHLRVRAGTDDTIVTALITAARRHAETFTRRALITQTWDLFYDRFPSVIRVPLAPLQSVTTVKYIDTGGTQQTLANTEYRVDTDSEPGRITEAWGTVWPTIRTVTNAVEIRFVAGYGAASTDVPENIIQGIKILIAHWYENREVTSPLVKETPESFKALLWDERVLEF